MIYGVTTLELPPGKVNEALGRLATSLTSRRGELRACWYSEIGRLNRVMAIHGYASGDALVADRQDMLTSGDPLGVADLATSVETQAFAPFPGVDFLPPGKRGPVFEVRTYQLKRSGLAATFAAWDKVLAARRKLSELAVVMYGIDGRVPCFMHIWPYATLNDRLAIRDDAVRQGVWPPPGGLPHLETMQSEIFLPAAFSPLH